MPNVSMRDNYGGCNESKPAKESFDLTSTLGASIDSQIEARSVVQTLPEL